jgi:TonB family protein
MDTTLLGNLLAYSAQVGLVVAIGAGLAALVRVDAAGVRYVYWRALLALCLVLPWLQVPRFVVVPMNTAPPAVASVSLPAMADAIPAPPVSDATIDWVSFVVWILVAGVCFRTCRVGVGLWRLRRLRAAGRLAPPSVIHDEVQELVRTRAEIRYVPSGQPVTFGFRRPVVLLPEMLRSQPEEIQRVVLCHELFHVRRRDWLWVVAEEMVQAALWFHPAVCWLVSRVRLAREEVVDELTVLATAERRAYMEALLVFADTQTQAPAAPFARRRHLFRRMLLISKEAVMSSKRILISVAAMTVIVAASVGLAVSVFPLTQTVIAQGRAAGPAPEAGANQAGPLERQAKPITPENPIPRRTFSVLPQNPPDDGAGVVAVSVRVVVDRQGRVGEARSSGGGVRGGRGRGPEPVALPSDAFLKASLDAVRQWQYDPPANGPIAFDVTFAFMPGAEPRLIAHGGPVGAAGFGVIGGASGGPVGGVVMQSLPPPPPPAPPPPVPPELQNAVRVGGNIGLPQKVKHADPVYPPIAQSARVQGVVIVELIIDREGRVGYARTLRSIPLLDASALDAVRQWEFTPTHLNGSPVPVVMTATVQFSLQ